MLALDDRIRTGLIVFASAPEDLPEVSLATVMLRDNAFVIRTTLPECSLGSR